MKTKEQVYNFVVYLIENKFVSRGSSLGKLRTQLYGAVGKVFGKNALTQIDLVTTVNKALSDTGVTL